MVLSLEFLRKNIFYCFLYLIFTIPGATSSFGAVLNPFPTRDRRPQYQQESRRPQMLSVQEMVRFKQEIDKFQCPQLKKLHVRLRDQYKTAVSTADKAYYRRFLNELYREMDEKNCTY